MGSEPLTKEPCCDDFPECEHVWGKGDPAVRTSNPRNLPQLLRDAERRVNAFVFHKAYPEFCRIPADRDHDLDLLLCEAADEIERLQRENAEFVSAIAREAETTQRLRRELDLNAKTHGWHGVEGIAQQRNEAMAERDRLRAAASVVVDLWQRRALRHDITAAVNELSALIGAADGPAEPRELTDAESIERKDRTGQNRSHTTRFTLMEGERGIFIDDDEFTYDALLKVQGDFADDATRRAYMQAICDVLNQHEDRIPWRQPDETTAPRELTDAESIERKERTGQNRSHTTRFSLMEGERGAFIDDDEFTYDALLKVQGDFEDDATRRAYMQAICDVLNEHEDRIPWRQPEKT